MVRGGGGGASASTEVYDLVVLLLRQQGVIDGLVDELAHSRDLVATADVCALTGITSNNLLRMKGLPRPYAEVRVRGRVTAIWRRTDIVEWCAQRARHLLTDAR